jgi:hypothetical protein
MTADSTMSRSTAEALGSLGLPPWLAVILRKIRQAFLSDEEKRLIHLMEFAASTFGAPLLAATSLDDLDDRIDAMIERPELSSVRSLLFASLPTSAIEPAALPEPSPQAAAALGLGSQDLVREAFHLALAELMALERLSRKLGRSVLQAEAEALRTAKPLAFLSDPRIPPEVSACALAGVRAEVCAFAYVRALLADVRPDPWLARAIAERWVEAQRSHLRLIASIPEAEVPYDLVPASERMDLAKLVSETKEIAGRTTDLLRRAIESGHAVYPPEAEPDDD